MARQKLNSMITRNSMLVRLFKNTFDPKTGRAAPGSTVMAAHGTHPVYLKQMLDVGLDKQKFKNVAHSSKVPTFKSHKQFMTLGGGLYTTTQMSKASQYSPPVNKNGYVLVARMSWTPGTSMHTRQNMMSAGVLNIHTA